MILALICAVSSQARVKETPLFEVMGQFMEVKRATYIVYELNKTGSYVPIETKKNQRNFSITCEVGKSYVIQFQDLENNVKFLVVEATHAGGFALDVDFSSTKHAILKHTGTGYRLKQLEGEIAKL